MTLHRSRTLFFLVGRDFLQNAKRLRSWKSSLNLAKQRPASHITAFAILHELTAIIPFAVIYFPVKWCQISSHIPLSKDLIQEGNKRINRVRTYFSLPELDENSTVLIDLSITYGLVKLALPARLALSVLLTPALASLIHRSSSILRSARGKLFGRQ